MSADDTVYEECDSCGVSFLMADNRIAACEGDEDDHYICEGCADKCHSCGGCRCKACSETCGFEDVDVCRKCHATCDYCGITICHKCRTGTLETGDACKDCARLTNSMPGMGGG